MSNEYKDWYNSFTERQKEIYEICMKYPFLIPRCIDGEPDEEFEYGYLELEIPRGWRNLFFQMCDDLKLALEKENSLYDFYFLQVKEKYNRLECYPNKASEEVQLIIDKYSAMASYICTICGRPATYETRGYIAAFCDNCWKDLARHERGEWIIFKSYFKIVSFQKGTHSEKTISFEEEWNRYIKENGYAV